jgi:hypothetical protein
MWSRFAGIKLIGKMAELPGFAFSYPRGLRFYYERTQQQINLLRVEGQFKDSIVGMADTGYYFNYGIVSL